jgi:hypothetical protein
VTGAAIEPTAFFAHKKAIRPFFCACTNHFNHILSKIIMIYGRRFMPHQKRIVNKNSHEILVFKKKFQTVQKRGTTGPFPKPAVIDR